MTDTAEETTLRYGCAPGDLFVEKDALRFGRSFRVVSLIARPEHLVQRPTAVCIVGGKVSAIALDRLLDKSRFTRQEI